MKFRRKPREFEAFQYTGQSPWPPGVLCDPTPANAATKPYVVTAHEQRVFLSPGDWVVAEPNGKGHYPIKNSIMFEQNEVVNEPTPTVSR